LRRVVDEGESAERELRRRQLDVLDRLPQFLDVEVLASGRMWR
jgi:hypothetical protein